MAKHMKSSQKTPTQPGQSSQSQSQPGQSPQQKDAEALLKEDHRKVEGLFRQFEGAEEHSRKQELARQICNELIIHSRIEEEIFYPACRARNVEDGALDEAQVEHDALKFLIGDLLGQSPGSAFYDAKLTVLKEYVKHHVEEEEKAGSGIFAKARKADVDMDALGLRLQELKQRLTEQAESGGLEPPQPRALTMQPGGFNQQRQESEMARWNERERDDRGRFMEEDDYRGGGRFGAGGYQGRYAQGEGEYRGPGRVRGGSQGYGSQRGGEFGGRGYGGGGYSEYGGAGGGGSSGNREYGGGGGYAAGYGGGYGTGSGGGYDSDWDMDRGGGYGRSGGPGGYRGMGGYGGSGEFGGQRGSGRGFGGSERDEQGRFMTGDDDNGDMRGSRGGQRGGSRGGFERERDDYGRYMSEDEGNGGGRGGSRGGYRSGSPGSRGGRGGNDDHRGWFGDSRGHSEAARRGWQNRDD